MISVPISGNLEKKILNNAPTAKEWIGIKKSQNNMQIAQDTKSLITDVTNYLSERGISEKDLKTLKALLFSVYIEGFDNGLSQAQKQL